ncbi:MAG: hypothetical protein CMJ31_08400 [Phycisphaerae bacterium]|nr:hypothetical protein [Phycisphaerae bacterium]
MPRSGREHRRRRRRASAALGLLGGSPVGDRVNVTPLIDVVMVLIIFYLIVGRLVLERRGGVDLPLATEGEVEGSTDRPIVVLVDENGSVKIDAETILADEAGPMVARLHREDPTRTVQLRADRSVGFGRVRPVLGSLREAGIGAVQMAARDQTGGAR